MHIITSKILPPVHPTILKRYGKATEYGGFQLQVEAKYCPAMDLIATYVVPAATSTAEAIAKGSEKQTEDQNYHEDDDAAMSVDVWRFNGQQVFTIAIEPEGFETTRVDVIDVEWRDDGQILAILSSDNIIRLVNSFSGKTVHKFSSVSSLPSSVSPKSSFWKFSQLKQSMLSKSGTVSCKSTTIAYSTHFTTPSSIYSQLEQANADNGTELDDLLGLNVDVARLLKANADLPRELASVDVETFLPRLACLPPPGFGVEDLFSTRNSIDSMFHSSRKNLRSGMLDLFTAGRDDGGIHLRMFDSFEIGDVNLSTAAGLPKAITSQKVMCIATHPFTDKLYVISNGSRNRQPDSVLLLELDLKFISQSPTTLSVLATKATQLNNILRYLKQVQTLLAREVKTAFELPARFMGLLNEDLTSQNDEGASFATVAYHTLVTGQVSGVFKEWLTDSLGERGAKRWEKAVGDCLDLVRRLISEGWGPAVERSGVVASRLAGMAGSDVQGDREWSSLGIDKKVVDELQQTLDVMAICGEDVLREVALELSGFSGFMKWLKWEVDAASLEDTSERLDELRESNEQNDIIKIFDYIDRALVGSNLQRYIGEATSQRLVVEAGSGFYTQFKEGREKSTEQAKQPSLGELLLRMEEQCQKLFEQIALNLRQRTLISHVADLPLEPGDRLLDVKVVVQPEYGAPQIHVLGQTKAPFDVSYVLVNIRDADQHGPSGKTVVKSLSPDASGKVLDAKFVDDAVFMLLVQLGDEVRIYSHGLLGVAESAETWQLRHTFDQGLMESGMKPHKLAINGRKYRRAVAVVDQDGKGYCVFDIDTNEVKEGSDMAIG